MRKIALIFLSAVLVLLLCVGCGKAAGDSYSGDKGVSMDSVAPSEKGELDLESTAESSRKLIRTVSVNAQTKKYDDFLAQVRQKVTDAGGYIEQSSENNSASRDYRSASMTLRIPAGETDGLLGLIGALGTVTRQEENIKDVTLSYVDTESRLKALRAEEASLLAILAEAETVADIITVRDRLTEVQYEIESYESVLRTYDNQVDYATVSLYVTEVAVELPVNESVWGEIGGNLAEALVNIGNFFRGAFVFLVSALPYLLVFVAVPGGIVYLIVRLSIARHRKKKSAQKSE